MDTSTAGTTEHEATMLEYLATMLRCGMPVNIGKIAAKYDITSEEAAALVGRAEARNDDREDAEKAGTTDLGNARRLVNRHGHELRHVDGLGWLVWDGRRWAVDRTGEVMRRAKATAVGILGEALLERDEDRRKRLAKWAATSESAARLRDMVSVAATEPEQAITIDELDADPWSLNVANGVLDLRPGRCGELRPHDPAELHTKIAAASYNGHYDPRHAPNFDKFIKRILPDPKVRRYVQQFVGYSLTGDTSEQVLAFLWGSGSNGKSTLLDAVRDTLGGYAWQATGELLVSKRERGAGDEAAKASLRGRRLVTTVEVDDGKRMAEGLVKELTGERKITAKLMRRNPIEFDNVSKIFLAANHKPVVTRGGDAMWRRIRLIPFTEKIAGDEIDKKLPEKLATERNAILAWAVDGLIQLQAESTWYVPPAVLAATADYREESNLLREWLDEFTVEEASATSTFKELKHSYVNVYCEREKIKMPMKARQFGDLLSEAGFAGDTGTGNVAIRRGLRLKTTEEASGGLSL
jgi:putative DNA primase/helicase